MPQLSLLPGEAQAITPADWISLAAARACPHRDECLPASSYVCGAGFGSAVEPKAFCLRQPHSWTAPMGRRLCHLPVLLGIDAYSSRLRAQSLHRLFLTRLREVHGAVMPQEFFELLRPHAEKVFDETGIPVEIMLAQAALETGWLRSPIRDKHTGQEAFNLFNIKGEGPAGSVVANDIDYIKGKPVHVEAKFRAYNDYAESFTDYASLLTEAPRYASALAVRDDPVAFAWELQRAGYATDPKYASKLVSIMQRHMGMS